MGLVHDLQARDRFYELVCVVGVSLTEAVERVGAGASAVVYNAEVIALGRLVAV